MNLTSITLNYHIRDFFNQEQLISTNCDFEWKLDAKLVSRTLSYVAKHECACAFFHFEDGMALRVYSSWDSPHTGVVEFTRIYSPTSEDEVERISMAEARKRVKAKMAEEVAA